MRVEQILARKGDEVATIPPDSLVADALRELGRRGIGALVVSSDGLRAEGIVSERDVVRALASDGAAALGLEVSRIMTREVVTCDPDDTIEEVMQAMTSGRFRHVPVVRHGDLLGLVSIGDVVKEMLHEQQFLIDRLEHYITT